jgi:hypothetical protein
MLINPINGESFPALLAGALEGLWWRLFGTIINLTWRFSLVAVTTLSPLARFLMICKISRLNGFVAAVTSLHSVL